MMNIAWLTSSSVTANSMYIGYSQNKTFVVGPDTDSYYYFLFFFTIFWHFIDDNQWNYQENNQTIKHCY